MSTLTNAVRGTLGPKARTVVLEKPWGPAIVNSGEEPSVVLDRVVAGKDNFGFNALTGEFGDMVQFGVLDPCKVTRSALQNAASIAGLVLTTDCMIAQMPEDAREPAQD
jgi:chaperonin GroEL